MSSARTGHFSDGSARLLKAGSVLTFGVALPLDRRGSVDQASVGIVFYPKGTSQSTSAAGSPAPRDYNDLELPPGGVTRTEAYSRLPKPTRMDAFQPHMHMRGQAQCLEAIYPNASSDNAPVNTRGASEREVLGCVDRFDFNWQVAYVFDDAVAPFLPAGTILQSISIFDNTAKNKRNPDPTKWVGFGAAQHR